MRLLVPLQASFGNLGWLWLGSSNAKCREDVIWLMLCRRNQTLSYLPYDVEHIDWKDIRSLQMNPKEINGSLILCATYTLVFAWQSYPLLPRSSALAVRENLLCLYCANTRNPGELRRQLLMQTVTAWSKLKLRNAKNWKWGMQTTKRTFHVVMHEKYVHIMYHQLRSRVRQCFLPSQ